MKKTAQIKSHLLSRDVEVRAVLVLAVGGVLDGPGQRALEGHDKVDERPSDDNVVVGDDAEGGEHGRQPDS